MENTRVSHYEIGRRLGRGGMGEVYEAVDLDLDRRVALKFVAPELAADPDALARFEREARSAAALHHPHIATLFAFERDGARMFIAMELVAGESLRERIGRGPLEIPEALAIARDVANALAAAHRRGIAHRDVKPENLMFDADGAVKLMDFGLARAVQATRITMTGSTLGTAAYMAPESVRGSTGPPADVFALGVVLHEMLAAELPFAGDSPLALMFVIANEAPKPLRTARPEVPEAVAALVGRMLEKDSSVRPDAASVARELAALTGTPEAAPCGPGDTVELDALPIAGSEQQALAPTPRPRGRHPRGWVWAGIAVLAATIAALALMPRDRRDDAVALNNRGFELMQADSMSEARTQLEAALEADPDYPLAMLNLATVLRETDDPNRAAALYGRVLREHPRVPELASRAHDGLAEIDLESGALPSAIEHYRQALALDSTIVGYANNLGHALTRAGRANEAIPVLERAIVRFPGEASLHKNLGIARLRADDPAAAIRAFDAALSRNPALASAWGYRAEAKARLRDLAGARADWDAYLGMLHDETERPAIEVQLRRLGAI